MATEREINKLIATLKFYASDDTYKSRSKGFTAHYDPEPTPIDKDKGKLARQVLGSLEVRG